jgi:predicted O-linked N-acetylglucosamine transferase (SPINDLY family)
MDEPTRAAFARALAVHRQGDAVSAEASYRSLYSQAPHPRIAHMLALALHQQQRTDEALPWFERAEARPSAAFHVNYASALLAAGHGAEAEAQSRLALAAAPGHPGARLNLAMALEAQQRFDAAIEEYRALESLPDVGPSARRGRIRALLHSGRVQDARDAMIYAGASDDPETALLRAEVELESEHPDEAQSALEVAAASRSVRARATLLQARLARQRGDGGKALGLLDDAAALEPDNRAATLHGAALLLERGDAAAAVDRLRGWLATHPRDAAAHSMYLRCACYLTEIDAAQLLAENRRWAEAHAPAAEYVAPRARREGEPLRIGWLSPAFRNGPVQTFLAGALRELRQRGLSWNVLYNSNPRTDPSSASLRAIGDRWEDIAALDDAAVTRLIRGDGVDVLVDLAGHARHGRLAVLARRAAPVQVTWLDSLGTTGIEAMDFVLTDPVSSPSGSESGFVERLLHLPRVRLCYTPPIAAARPGIDTKRLISLNHFAKLNDAVIAIWAEILRALPDWTLHLKARGSDDDAAVIRMRDRFARHGVDRARIECSGYASVPKALSSYRSAAIALDPFPFSGGANSCDALWMGLPLVTWPRDTLISRQGAALLDALERREWIARDAKDYAAIVRGLAGDRAERARWSDVAAARVAERLSDVQRFATELMGALERAWSLRASEGFAPVWWPLAAVAEDRSTT